ncbi:MAG: hypothetical protein RLZZ165_1024 [Bacteroidota bacterium]|jgi:YD repeat-containing protein
MRRLKERVIKNLSIGSMPRGKRFTSVSHSYYIWKKPQLRNPGAVGDLYDPEGNLVRKEDKAGGGHWEYRWQGNGMLREVVRPDGRAVAFVYDALGRRIAKSFAGTVTRWVWDGDVPLHEWSLPAAAGLPADPV